MQDIAYTATENSIKGALSQMLAKDFKLDPANYDQLQDLIGSEVEEVLPELMDRLTEYKKKGQESIGIAIFKITMEIAGMRPADKPMQEFNEQEAQA